MTDVNNAKAEMSQAAFYAVVAHALGSCEFSKSRLDAMGIDAICNFQSGGRLVSFRAQLKSTTRLLKTTVRNDEECWILPVDCDQLERYRAASVVLFLVIFPDDDYEEWLKILKDSIVLKNQIYWVRIEDAGDAKSVVYVPKRNRLTQESLLREIVGGTK